MVFSFEIEILIYDATWVNLVNVMLTGIVKAKRTSYDSTYTRYLSTTAKFSLKVEERLREGKKLGGYCLMGTEFQFE